MSDMPLGTDFSEGDSVDLGETLSILGRHHREYGVEAAHYAPFREALIEALREISGDKWGAKIEAACSRFYNIVAAMVRVCPLRLHLPRLN